VKDLHTPAFEGRILKQKSNLQDRIQEDPQNNTPFLALDSKLRLYKQCVINLCWQLQAKVDARKDQKPAERSPSATEENSGNDSDFEGDGRRAPAKRKAVPRQPATRPDSASKPSRIQRSPPPSTPTLLPLHLFPPP
jgi:hypothetical protein